MASLENRQGPQSSRGQVCRWLLCERRFLIHLTGSSSDTAEKGQREHHQRAIAVPPDEAAYLVLIQSQVFPVGEILFNGLITNDKFCMSRTARLQLSYWRMPRSARHTSGEGVQSPVEENCREYLPQQETYEKTTMERSSHLSGTA